MHKLILSAIFLSPLIIWPYLGKYLIYHGFSLLILLLMVALIFSPFIFGAVKGDNYSKFNRKKDLAKEIEALKDTKCYFERVYLEQITKEYESIRF